MMKLAEPPIDEIVRRIVAEVDPRRVVLFGSRARGDARPDSDVDLLVEVATGDERRLQAARSAAAKSGWSVDVVVLTSQEVEEQTDDPGRVAWAIAREGREMYAVSGLQPWNQRPRRVCEGTPPSVGEFVRLAETDLGMCAQLMKAEDVAWSGVCFHAQQAGEKYLKALVVRRHAVPERTHELEKLLAACRSAGDALPGLDADAALLSPHATATRYGSHVFTAEEGTAAVAAAGRIRDAARALLAPL